MIVLDTNVISELMRPTPSSRVAAWISRHPGTSLFTTTISQCEILYGVALLPSGKRRATLKEVVNELFEIEFEGRLLPFDSSAASLHAEIAATRRRKGRPISQFDAQIAAIARSRDASLATRNVEDFQDCGVRIHDPWA